MKTYNHQAVAQTATMHRQGRQTMTAMTENDAGTETGIAFDISQVA